MALPQSVIDEMLAAIEVGHGTDLVRALAEWALQELIESQASERLGAGFFERNVERVTHRNGHRPKVLSTKTGDLHLKIPKLRQGSFFPEILEPRRRIDQALHAVIMEEADHAGVRFLECSRVSGLSLTVRATNVQHRIGFFRRSRALLHGFTG